MLSDLRLRIRHIFRSFFRNENPFFYKQTTEPSDILEPEPEPVQETPAMMRQERQVARTLGQAQRGPRRLHRVHPLPHHRPRRR